MPEQHDTNANPPVGAVKCPDHENCFKEVYDRMMPRWIAVAAFGLFSIMVVWFGIYVYNTGVDSDKEQNVIIQGNKDNLIKIDTHLEYIRSDQSDMKIEQAKLNDKVDRMLRLLEKRNP